MDANNLRSAIVKNAIVNNEAIVVINIVNILRLGRLSFELSIVALGKAALLSDDRRPYFVKVLSDVKPCPLKSDYVYVIYYYSLNLDTRNKYS